MKQQRTLLRKLRRDREITLEVLAIKTRVERSRLSRAERGLRALSDDEMGRLAKFFKVDDPKTLQQVA